MKSKVATCYEDLTLTQRIGLKGQIQTNPAFCVYKMVWIFFGFKAAINYFLTDDINLFFHLDPHIG